MDKSETYIKMCDCPEIQGQKKCKPEWGVEISPRNYYGIHDKDDWYEMRLDDYVVFNCTVLGYVSNKPQFGCAVEERRIVIPKDNVFWLPQQDQLQEMVKDAIDCPSHSSVAILINFGNSLHKLVDKDFDYWLRFTSMEQLWLAFVMLELHKKKWDEVMKWQKQRITG